MGIWGITDYTQPPETGASRISVFTVGGKLVPSIAAGLLHGVIAPVMFPNLQEVIDGECTAEMVERAYDTEQVQHSRSK